MNERSIPYYRPKIGTDEIDAVVDSMRNGWLTTGPKVHEFERAFSRACGVKHAIALNSCTAGLHLGLAALGVGPGDEVIMPSLTFVAGAQCVRHLGAIPVLADVDRRTLCMTLDEVRPLVTARTKVIMPMHYGGAPLNMREIVEYAQSRSIRVLEDAAHAVGTLDKEGRWAGTISDAASYSFYATKNITCAEGGMFITNDDELAHKVRILSLHGMDKDAWKRYTVGSGYGYDVVAVGYKYNMPDMAAALGLAQLSKLNALQAERDQLAQCYLTALHDIAGIDPVGTIPKEPSRHSWCIFAILVSDEVGLSRDDIISGLLQRGISTSVHFIPIHKMTAYKHTSHPSLPVTEWASQRMISLPLYPGMTTEDVAYVCSGLQSIIGTSKVLSPRAAPT